MREIVASAAFGFIKAFSEGLLVGEAQPIGGWMHSLVGPAREEMMYRGPLYLGFGSLPTGWTAVPFAMEHVIQESALGMHRSSASAFSRFADVFLGGVLYEKAFRRWGILGAIAAHAAHNVALNVGLHASRRVRVRMR